MEQVRATEGTLNTLNFNEKRSVKSKLNVKQSSLLQNAAYRADGKKNLKSVIIKKNKCNKKYRTMSECFLL